MSLRIIAGQFGGRIIAAPDSATTHPMSERARNALFNSIGEVIIGANVLDAFAGSGAAGLEALSRGAGHVTFIERDRQAAQTLSRNIATLSVESETTLIKTSVENWLKTRTNQNFDLIIADPPYNNLQANTIKKLFGLLKPKALMVLSHPDKNEILIESDDIAAVSERHYAAATLTFYRRKG